MNKLAAAMVVMGVLAASAPAIGAENYPPDNSGKNVRDRQDATLTPRRPVERQIGRGHHPGNSQGGCYRQRTLRECP